MGWRGLTCLAVLMLGSCGQPAMDRVVDGRYRLFAADVLEGTDLCYWDGDTSCPATARAAPLGLSWEM